MPFCAITCACGHRDDLDAFTRTPIFGELPKNVYQCPRCALAIERRPDPPSVRPSGYVMPGAVRLVPVAARL